MTGPVDLDALRWLIAKRASLDGTRANVLVAEVEALRSDKAALLHAAEGYRRERDALQEENARLRAALTEIADSDPIDNALDPDRNRRIANEVRG